MEKKKNCSSPIILYFSFQTIKNYGLALLRRSLPRRAKTFFSFAYQAHLPTPTAAAGCPPPSPSFAEHAVFSLAAAPESHGPVPFCGVLATPVLPRNQRLHFAGEVSCQSGLQGATCCWVAPRSATEPDLAPEFQVPGVQDDRHGGGAVRAAGEADVRGTGRSDWEER